ncbi:hypothetical protein H0H93_015628 [Arthromyces matolae]|nr:hypothetical protein H0H93_015628 [Arthromyces matolae]
MLSAIAARKAAQVARQNADAGEKDSMTTVENQGIIKPSSRPSSKRKISSQNPNPPKRKRNEKEVPLKTLVYPTDSFKAQEDLIVITSDEDEDSFPGDFSSPEPLTGKGRWSPSIPLNDSSDEEGIDTQATAAVPPSNAAEHVPDVLSTFCPTPDRNLFFLQPAEVSSLCLESDSSNHAIIIALQPEETLCLLGAYRLSVIRGSIALSGVCLSSSPAVHRVFAPRSTPLPVIEGIDASGAIPHIHQLPTSLHSLISTSVALVLLQELHSGVAGLGDICRTFDRVFEPLRWNRFAASPIELSGVHYVSSQTKDVQAFELPMSWRRALSSQSTQNDTSIHFIKGPKKSGKSTFARTLVNSLLTRYQKVAFLECDLGQSEFTPGGMVALNIVSTPLFGPPFTHPTLPNSAHYIGGTTPRSSPSLYLNAVQSILDEYRLDIQTPAVSIGDDSRISDLIPLVVNTMGWNKGLGADLTLKLQEMVEPTDIYEIEAPFDPAWPSLPARNLRPSPSVKVHLLKPAPISILSTNYSAADHRSLSIMSYLHAVFPKSTTLADDLPQRTALTWHTSTPICAQPPFEVDCRRSFDKVILAGAGTEDVVPSEIACVLNGALVALVTCAPGTLDLDLVDDTERIPYTQGFAPPSPGSSKCLGLALIRSVSPLEPQTQIHVLTPLPAKMLMDCRILVKGELELPIWGMLDHRGSRDEVVGEESRKVPFLQWGKGEGVGGDKRRIRRNLMRRAQT